MEMFPVAGGKVEINTANIALMAEDKGGATWTVLLTNGKYFVITKAEATKLRKLVNTE